jgi:CubicO group peptidase (beta-lactamase class C family)
MAVKRARELLAGLFVAVSLSCSREPTTSTESNQLTPPATPPDTAPAQLVMPATGIAVPGMQSYDQRITAVMQQYGIPGGAVAVVRDGKLIYARGFGYADVRHLSPVPGRQAVAPTEAT